MIQLLQTVEWSRLKWDISFSERINIQDILPQVGQTYRVHIRREDDISKKLVNIIWKPPHSDLNGWHDKRPSEILKSYVLTGRISNSLIDQYTFDFKVQAIKPLTKTFHGVNRTHECPFGKTLQRKYVFKNLETYDWESKNRLSAAYLDHYIYLAGDAMQEHIDLEELIFSKEKNKLILRYQANSWSARILNYQLSKKEQQMFERYLHQSSIITEARNDLKATEVFGAKYY